MGELADGITERYLPDVSLFHCGVPTNLGIWQEAGHEEAWMIALDCQPTQAAVRDYFLGEVMRSHPNYC